MEQDLQFIQNQLWFLIGLIGLVVVTNLICYFTRKSEKKREIDFGDLWEKGQLESLIKESREYLLAYPNRADALYFGAKAMIAKGKNLDEARSYLERFIQIEPSMAEEMQEQIDVINKLQGS